MNKKRINYLSWAEYFLALTKLISQRSKDPHTQVGAIIINPRTNTIISTGYNGFPRGCSDDEFPWGNESENWLETKYPYVLHAEANAIIHAQQNCEGFVMYTNFFPCHECAKLIIQSGIKNVFYYSDILNQEHWKNSYQASEKMFQASGINYQKINK
ncbi:MAG: dCMP deaminase family protein [Candidatus Moeniiplasma glomeromycotorum]|nr:dCMP deaminase family protein [Candidatus Moeniiplasma glomeromycotorum]MCE8169187.1 dCMP deaminase family protein [Candidatus Moeniiplasma glomeromycotorum]